MENARIERSNGDILKIELNNAGDYIAVSADNSALFDRFTIGYKHIVDLADGISGKIEEIEKKYEGKDDFSSIMDKTLELSGINVGFSKEAVRTVDGIFGAGTLKKYFRDVYEEIPDFLPDADCIMDFFEQIVPVMEKLFNCKMERQQKASKARMAKYQPQDHKRKGNK